MSSIDLARRLAGLALTVERDRPTAAHWIAAMALVAKTEPIPGRTRELAFVAGRARVQLHPFKNHASFT